MLILVVLWWMCFFSALGLCLGSFLNVVIHRLPCGLALSHPAWSFCPNCRNRIVWYDNLPVVSYLGLRGRCRFCWKRISPRYPLIELMTAMTVLVVFDAFFIGQVRDGLLNAPEIGWRLSADWPMLTGHIILFACLFGMSAIDIKHYWVDIRFTHLAAGCGFVLHAIWTPTYSRQWLRPSDSTAVVALAALGGFAAAWVVLQWWFRRGSGACDEDHDEPEVPPTESPLGRVWITVPLVVFLLYLVTVTAAGFDGMQLIAFPLRSALPLVLFLFVILYEASHVRPADSQIIEAIESEAPSARAVSLRELGILLFGIVPGALAFWWVTSGGDSGIDRGVVGWLHWAPLDGSWQPLWGMGTAATGYVIGAGIGWASRIIFSLILGKEAFGTGDIHMMAAAGCVAGWQVVALGFVLTCFIALFGWLVLIPFKRTRAIPLGPWLSLSFLIVAVMYKPLVATQVIKNFAAAADMLFFSN